MPTAPTLPVTCGKAVLAYSGAHISGGSPVSDPCDPCVRIHCYLSHPGKVDHQSVLT